MVFFPVMRKQKVKIWQQLESQPRIENPPLLKNIEQ